MKDVLLGMAVGDAIGVPYEFKSRTEISRNPCIDMIGNGTHNQPIGTWSDDSSMAFCMVESLINGWDLNDMSKRFINWFRNNYWTPHGRVFDMGFTTQEAILKLERGQLPPNCCGGMTFNHNGNGSVMRILPVIHYFIDNKIDNSVIRYKMLSDLSSMTHGHQLAIMSCFLLTEYGRQLHLNRHNTNKVHLKYAALENVKIELASIKTLIPFNQELFKEFNLLLDAEFNKASIALISGSGFCINTLIASIYCLMNTDNYKDAVLMAVNLGEDTDTTACVTGGLAGILYGSEGIPTNWVDQLVRKNDIIDLAKRYDEGKIV